MAGWVWKGVEGCGEEGAAVWEDTLVQQLLTINEWRPPLIGKECHFPDAYRSHLVKHVRNPPPTRPRIGLDVNLPLARRRQPLAQLAAQHIQGELVAAKENISGAHDCHHQRVLLLRMQRKCG
jgi:hypothetical protein